jgi:hypothetical protein
MEQQDAATRQALGYIRHQAAKRLADLRVLAARTAVDSARALEGVTAVQARFRPGQEWSVADVLAHLVDATRMQVVEPVRDLAAGRVPRPFAPDRPADRPAPPFAELCRDMARLLDETVRLVDALPERDGPPGAWEHPFFGPLGPRELIAYHRLHVMDHVRQIEAIKAAPGYPGPGSP